MSDPIETSSKTEEDKPALTFAKYGDEARRNDFELFLPRKKRYVWIQKLDLIVLICIHKNNNRCLLKRNLYAFRTFLNSFTLEKKQWTKGIFQWRKSSNRVERSVTIVNIFKRS